MKVAVFSDTHSNTSRMVTAVRSAAPDALIHLGDFERDAEVLRREFPELPLYSVCGNCDFYPKAPAKAVVSLGPVKAFLTHGHLYNVDWGTDSLVYAAQEAGCRIAMYGHTHCAENAETAGVKLLNPGTAGKGRELTYAMVEIFENGGIATEIRKL
ncbi:MAG: metallophosphoesterase [Oscillospiraceae bacterium]|nr:metallophosphoesterase [Oscillospiraceae bacterium]